MVYYYHFFFIKLFPVSLEKDDSDTDLDLTDGACCSETVTVCVHDGAVTVTVSGGDAKIQNAASCIPRKKSCKKKEVKIKTKINAKENKQTNKEFLLLLSLWLQAGRLTFSQF